MELLDFSIPVIVGKEFDFSAIVFFLTFGSGDDGEKFPISVVDCVFELAFEFGSSHVGMCGLDKVVDEPEEKGAVT